MNELDSLDSQLRCVTEAKSGWAFFVSLKDYVRYILGNPVLKGYVEELVEKRQELKRGESALEAEAIEELLASKDTIHGIIKREGLEQTPEVKNALTELDGYLNHTISSSWKLSDSIDRLLFDICKVIPDQKRSRLLKKFVDENPETRNIYGNFIFSKTLKKRQDFTKTIEHEQLTERWADWHKLSLVPKFIEASNIFDVPLDDGDGYFSYKLIQARIEYDKSRDESKFAEAIPEYRQSVLRVHSFLITKINQASSDTPEEKPASFDPEKSALLLGNKKITIAKSKDTNPHYLLQTIFKEPKKTWSFDEIAEDWDEPYDKNRWNRYYQAARAVNEKVEIQAHVKDFLKTSSSTVWVSEDWQ